MKDVFSDVVARLPAETAMETCFYMWWHFIGRDFCSAHAPERSGDAPFTAGDPETRRVHDAIFETLAEILRIPDERAQSCALHGLGHLRHTRGAPLVQRFIDAHTSELTPDARAWLESCRDGTVM
jgi:hypothetical protein